MVATFTVTFAHTSSVEDTDVFSVACTAAEAPVVPRGIWNCVP